MDHCLVIWDAAWLKNVKCRANTCTAQSCGSSTHQKLLMLRLKQWNRNFQDTKWQVLYCVATSKPTEHTVICSMILNQKLAHSLQKDQVNAHRTATIEHSIFVIWRSIFVILCNLKKQKHSLSKTYLYMLDNNDLYNVGSVIFCRTKWVVSQKVIV